MDETNTAPIGAIPASSTLLRSTLIAVVAAAVILVTIVLPAEYGVDPTGIGRVIGLTEMGEIKMSLAREAAEAEAAEAAAAAALTGPPAAPAAATSGAAPPSMTLPAEPATSAVAAGTAFAADTTVVTLQPNEAREFKLAMREGARVTYAWSTDGGPVNFDTHADRTAPPAISYHGYSKGSGERADTGVLVAAFDGMHGWFWRNRTGGVVTVTLQTTGDYQAISEVK